MLRRRIRTKSLAGSTAPTILVGMGLGLAAGFLLGELFAAEGPDALGRAITRWRRAAPPRSSRELGSLLQERLERALGPDGQSVDLIPVGKGALEIHGWVTSRTARTRALRIARDTLGSDIRLIDSLLVWGEDDAPTPPSGAKARESA